MELEYENGWFAERSRVYKEISERKDLFKKLDSTFFYFTPPEAGWIDMEMDAAVRQDFADRRDDHPDTGDGGHGRERADLVEMVLQGHGSVLQRAAGVYDIIGDLENILAAGMPGDLIARPGRRPADNHLHPSLVGFIGHVDHHGIDARMGKEPEQVAFLEPPAGHDLLGISFLPFQPQELIDTHLSDNVGKERQRKFTKRMEADDAADPGIHLLDREIGMAATEGMDQVTRLDAIGHHLGDFFDLFHLCRFNFIHDIEGILFPLIC